ncbi:MAG: PQQ-binding-like beta-propeller repeat protein, partial [Pirellulaceae bacterium]|nr:PQQ-binding-like beta-propeller repeat protein [Pirellulaceae bacterium]
RQIHVPAGAQSIVDQQIYVHRENQREYIEVVRVSGAAPAKAAAKPADTPNAAAANSGPAAADENQKDVLVRIPTDRIGRNGIEIGKDEAERLANNDIRRLKVRGIEAKIESRFVPIVRLYSLGDDGTVDCRDAESGESVWMNRVGDRRLGYSKMGIDDKYLTVINGGNLIKLDVTNGTEIMSVRTTSTPLFGAVHSGGFSLVPTIRNGVEGYPLDDPTRVPFMEIVQGIALAPPSKSPSSTRVAWGTNRGFVYVMESSGTPSILFRLNTDGIVSGRIAAAEGDRFYFGSEAGQVYGIRATRTGTVLWSRPYGEPFYNSPMVIGKQVLLRSTYGTLYSLDTDSGIMTWPYTVANVDVLLGAFDGKLFVRLLSGGFSVINLETGKTINTFNELVPQTLLVNSQTNRLYLVGKTGAVQCLRPEGEMLPQFSVSIDAPAEKPDEESPSADEPAGPAAAFAGQAADADPFAAGGDADPFAGGGADPFGAGAGDAMADPFATDGADPFGN